MRGREVNDTRALGWCEGVVRGREVKDTWARQNGIYLAVLQHVLPGSNCNDS